MSNKKLDAEEKFRINSPRKRLEEEMAKKAAANKSSILVKLPENIEEQMNRHKNDRKRLMDAMLGFPAILPTNSNENTEEDEETEEKRATFSSTERPTVSTRRSNSNSHPQQTRQNGGEARQSEIENFIEQILPTTSPTTKIATTTYRLSTSGLDETSWDVSAKNSEKSDDSFSRREPTR